MTGRRALVERLVLILAAWAVIQAAVVTVRAPGVFEGKLLDPDDYLRLVRVERLHETGAWYDGSIPRSNAPFGETPQWTRPLDVLLLGGTYALTPFLGFERGLFWAGALSAPVFQLVLLLLVPWIGAPFLSEHGRRLAVLAVLAQPAVMNYSLAGRADHHALILLAFGLMLGFLVHACTRPEPPRTAVSVGLAAGFGVWLSVEFLIPLAVALVGVAALYVRWGHQWARVGARLGGGLAVGLVVALLAERTSGTWVRVEYDRISVVHVVVGVLVWAFWATADRLRVWRRSGTAVGRAAVVLAGAAVGALVMALLFPRFFAGPMAEVDPRLFPLWLSRTEELQPLLVPSSLAGLGRFLAYLGPALVAIPFLGLMAGRGVRREQALPAVLLVGLVLLLAPALYRVRFAIYAEVVAALSLAWFLDRTTARLSAIRLRGWTTPARAGLTVLGLLGFMGAGALVQPASRSAPAGPAAFAARGECDLSGVVEFLNDPAGLGAKHLTILAFLDYGPELLYRTTHSVVATPQHRNADGILDSFSVFRTTNDRVAQSIIRRRGVDLLLLCPRGAEADQLASFPQSLYARLAHGHTPAWLHPVGHFGDRTRFQLYEVASPSPLP